MKILFEENELEFTELKGSLFAEKKISVIVARLDKIHPIVSGNKLFKLHYFLQEAFEKNVKTILTFGGAYSNHLAATAFACNVAGFRSIGIVRGEKPATVSHTLEQCLVQGMELDFISREEYNKKESAAFISSLQNKYSECIIIPEGGYHPLGADGASLILDKLKGQQATHICTAVGTGTTLAGLLKYSNKAETIIAVPVLKQLNVKDRIAYLCNNRHFNNLVIFNDYHFGGYAKKTGELINFMNEFYKEEQVPTDFVYTGKMMYAIINQIKAGYFAEGSKVICLHTGGLQGNDSMPPSTFVF